MRSIALISEKGGVSKTTTVLNLAAALARKGKRILVVDCDPQGNSSYVLLGGEKPRQPTLFEVVTGESRAVEAIVPTGFDGVDLIPADATLADATVVLATEVGRERRLRAALEEVEGDYDVVILDTAPTRSILTTNILNYVQELIVPFTPGLFGVLGLGQLQDDVAQVRRFLENKSLRIGGVIMTQVDKNNVHKDLEAQLRELFGDLVFKTRIPRSIKIEEAHARHESVLTYAPTSNGAVAYKALAEEILTNGERAKDRVGHPRRDPQAHDAA